MPELNCTSDYTRGKSVAGIQDTGLGKPDSRRHNLAPRSISNHRAHLSFGRATVQVSKRSFGEGAPYIRRLKG